MSYSPPVLTKADIAAKIADVATNTTNKLTDAVVGHINADISSLVGIYGCQECTTGNLLFYVPDEFTLVDTTTYTQEIGIDIINAPATGSKFCVHFEMHDTTTAYIYLKIQKNGEDIGFEYNTAETSYIAFDETLDTVLAAGDVLTVLIKNSNSGHTAYLKEFKICGSTTPFAKVV